MQVKIRKWLSLESVIGLKRMGKSCRLRWLNYLKPDVKRGNLTPQEQLLILELHSKSGNRWSKIAQYLPRRTDNEIKTYWRTRVQKQAKNLKIDSNSAVFQEMIRCLWIPQLSSSEDTELLRCYAINSEFRIDPTRFQLRENSSTSTSSSSSSYSLNIYNSPNIISECPKTPPCEMGDSDLNPFIKALFPFEDNSYDTDNFGRLSTGNFNDVMTGTINKIMHREFSGVVYLLKMVLLVDLTSFDP